RDRARSMVVVEVDITVVGAGDAIDPRTQRRSAVARPGSCPPLMHTYIGPGRREPQWRDRPGAAIGEHEGRVVSAKHLAQHRHEPGLVAPPPGPPKPRDQTPQ